MSMSPPLRRTSNRNILQCIHASGLAKTADSDTLAPAGRRGRPSCLNRLRRLPQYSLRGGRGLRCGVFGPECFSVVRVSDSSQPFSPLS